MSSSFHIVLSRSFDLEGMEQGAAEDRNPRHSIRTLARDLNATVHDPEQHTPSRLDRVLGRFFGTPEHWALARALDGALGPDDVVFACGAEGVTIPLRMLLRRKRPAFGMQLMTPSNRKLRLLLANPLIARWFELLVVSNEHKRSLVEKLTRVPVDRVFVLPEQTDTRFFTPQAQPSATEVTRPARKRPLIFSAGLEHRDYAVLADAIDGLEVDCLICAMSPNALPRSSRWPEQLPANMTFEPLEWPAFRQAYRDAAIVVVPLVHNLFSAGSTVVMEAMACRRPVVMTDIPGVAQDLAARDLVMTVPPRDAAALRAALIHLLENPDVADGYAERGHAAVLEDHTLEIAMHQLASRLCALRGIAGHAPVRTRDGSVQAPRATATRTSPPNRDEPDQPSSSGVYAVKSRTRAGRASARRKLG
jgi:glycosyltransferase involved in cell wall biosynthesis